MRRRVRALAAVLCTALLACPAVPAAAATTCHLGGPTPSWSAMRVSLPSGSDDLAVRLTAPPPALPVGGRDGWHIAAGIAVIDAANGHLVAARVSNYGSSPRRAVVRAEDQELLRQEFTGPDAPFEHQGGGLVPSLAPGTYYLVGFGSDGGSTPPSLGWAADVSLTPAVTCTPVGTGQTFDRDHTEFSDGTQVSAYGAGMVDGVSTTITSQRRLVVGLMDAATQVTLPAGSSALDYEMPDGRNGTISEQIVPFAGPAGEYSFTGTATGAFPLLLVSGVMLDVPIGGAP